MRRRLFALSALIAVPVAVAWATPSQSSAVEGTVVGFVAEVLRSYHYRQQPIDDGLSEQWLENYLAALDPERLFFTVADVAEFSRYRHTLDDGVRKLPADLSPALQMHDRFRQRVGERVAAVSLMLADPARLPSQGLVEVDREKAPWAADKAALDALWRLRIAEQLSRATVEGEDQAKVVERLKVRYTRMGKDIEQQDQGDIMEMWLGALGATFDPHSVWFKPATKEDFDISMRDSLQGIGATLRTDGEYTKVVSLVPGGPAALSGLLQPEDRIVAVAQAGQGPEDIIGLRIDRVVKLIRGAKGTEVSLTIIPADAADPSVTRTIRIMRDEVIIAEAAAKGSIHEVGGTKVGVIDVPSFYQEVRRDGKHSEIGRSTTADVRRIVGELGAQGAKALVIDLRENGGGALNQSVDLTGLFIDRGPVVQIKDRADRVEVLEDQEGGVAWGGPLVVLTSVHSASASEIFAGAIQDYRRGLIVGAPATHGKGSVQELIDLGPMINRMVGDGATEVAGALKYTTNQFYRVSGRSTQAEGVLADIVIPSPSDTLPYREANLDNPLPYDEIRPARFSPFLVKNDLPGLRAKSAKRVAGDPAFQLMAELRALRDEREGRPIAIDATARKAELDTWKALEARSAALGIDDGKRDPVLEEALQIAKDVSGS